MSSSRGHRIRIWQAALVPLAALCCLVTLGASSASASELTMVMLTPSNVWHNGATTISFTVTSTHGSLYPIDLSFTYSCDGGATSAKITIPVTSNSQYSHQGTGSLAVGPGTAVPLADGKHTVVITPYSHSAKAAWTFKGTSQSVGEWFDTRAPAVSWVGINVSPAFPDGNPDTGNPTVAVTSTVTDATSGMAGMSFQTTTNAGTTPTAWTAWAAFKTPALYTLPTNLGTQMLLWAQYKDVAGNVCTKVVATHPITIIIDSEAPVTTAKGADGTWHSKPVTLTFVPSDVLDANPATHYQVDTGAWLVGPTAVIPAPAGGANDGVHTVGFYSVDSSNNTETPAKSCQVMIDTKAPVTKAPKAASVNRGHSVALAFSVVDSRPGSPTATVTIKIKSRAGKVVKVLKLGTRLENVSLTARYRCRLPKGVYRFAVYANDQAGNTQSKIGGNKLTVKQGSNANGGGLGFGD